MQWNSLEPSLTTHEPQASFRRKPRVSNAKGQDTVLCSLGQLSRDMKLSAGHDVNKSRAKPAKFGLPFFRTIVAFDGTKSSRPLRVIWKTTVNCFAYVRSICFSSFRGLHLDPKHFVAESINGWTPQGRLCLFVTSNRTLETVVYIHCGRKNAHNAAQ